jgi:single-stranded-DNA-specific exonuclease
VNLVEAILTARGLSVPTDRQAFLRPDYALTSHDPFLLPDMDRAVRRLTQAKERQEKVVIYGDYDIDGLTATTVLLESFHAFGIETTAFIPNRFIEGYGLSLSAIETLASDGTQLIVTVDCGSLSHTEIDRANELGVDVIVTDHHTVDEQMPAAVAVINPKRSDHTYPFIDLAGVGVAFKLVQALQTKLGGLPDGHEKWLLDLVALGTVCDVVNLSGENRTNVYWGLEVMKKTKRPGLKLLMAVSQVLPEQLVARSLGFGLGPRLNAAGRLETAQLALDLLTTTDNSKAFELAELLDGMNRDRRVEQDRIFKAARAQAEEYADDNVLVVSDQSWSHGIIGIVAAKLLETYHKPTFVLQEMEDGIAKGSARSFGDFSAVEGIKATEQLLVKGGGHKLAAGVTLQVAQIDAWRKAVNEYYRTLKLRDQERHFAVKGEVTLLDFDHCTEENVSRLSALEPYGNGNPEPIFEFQNLVVTERRVMGGEGQHVKYTFRDKQGQSLQMIAFNKASVFVDAVGEVVSVWCELGINEWKGRRNVEGRLLKISPYFEDRAPETP